MKGTLKDQNKVQEWIPWTLIFYDLNKVIVSSTNLEYPYTVAGDLPVLGRLQVYLYDDCAILLPLLAGCGVLARHPTRLVEHVRGNPTRVCTYVYLDGKKRILIVMCFDFLYLTVKLDIPKVFHNFIYASNEWLPDEKYV